jgi:uncharacterized protein YndB with AHSA1/START domain
MTPPPVCPSIRLTHDVQEKETRRMSTTTQATQQHSITVRATPDRVWEAITQPAYTTKYFYGSVIESGFIAGSPYAAWAEDRSQQFADGEVLEASPPRVLSHTWRTLWDEEAAAEPHSRVTWLIEPRDGETTALTVVHDQLEDAPKTAESVADGWGHVLGGLKVVLEADEATGGGEAPQIYQLFIKARPEAIWEAIIAPEFTSKYFYGARINISPTHRQSLGPDGSVRGDSEVFEFDPPRRLVHEWRSLYDPDMAVEEPSRVTWEIEPQGDGTSLLTVIHDRLEQSPLTARGVAGQGWMLVLSGLKTLLETGEPLASS